MSVFAWICINKERVSEREGRKERCRMGGAGGGGEAGEVLERYGMENKFVMESGE
jgi:hypothetical protein